MYIWVIITAVACAPLLWQLPWIVTGPVDFGTLIFRLVNHGFRILVFDLKARYSIRTIKPPPSRKDNLTAPLVANLGSNDFFTYSPLPSNRHIRLLRPYRLSRKTKHDSILRCDLETVSLDASIWLRPYRAISYTWDDQSRDQVIICNGKSLLVTRNCVEIIRLALRLSRPFHIWIDAISINQSDMAEKATQLLLMSEIYTKAFQVNVWLGQPSYGDDLAFHYAWLDWCCDVAPTIVEKMKLRQHLHGLIEDRGHSKYIRQVLNKRWWWRVWTIQESHLAPNSWWACPVALLVNCGELEMPFRCLSGFLHEFCSSHGLFTRNVYSFNDSPSATAVSLHHPRCKRSLSKHGIPRLMFSTRLCGVTDQRDRLYGLYSVFQNAGIDVPRPEYHKEVHTVFWEYTVAICKNTQSLELLGITGTPASKASRLIMPSWVPNYAEPYRHGDFVGRFHASGNSPANFRFSPDARVLETCGTIVDTIRLKSYRTQWQEHQHYSAYIPDSLAVDFESEIGATATTEAYQDWIAILDSCLRMDGYSPQSCMRYISAFGQAITSDCTQLLESINQHGRAIFTWTLLLAPGQITTQQLQRAQEALQSASEFDSNAREKILQSEKLMTLWILKTDPETATLTHYVRTMMRGKTVFATEGGFIGSAHTSIQVGDKIALIPGIDRPMVLHPTPVTEVYEVVGPAFIEGMMKGEQWNPRRVHPIRLV